MDLELTEEQRMFQETVRSFVEREMPPNVVRDNDTNEAFSTATLHKLATQELLGGPIPQEYGGLGLDQTTWGIVCEEIGRGSAAVFTTANTVQISLVAQTILLYGTDEQKQRYLPGLCRGETIGCFGLTEPTVGSDPSSMEIYARRDGDDWVINGGKMWVSNGGIANLALVFAQTDRSLPRGKTYPGIAAFLVERETPGFSTIDIHGKLGLRSSNTAQLIFQDCRLPGNSLLGEVGRGFQIAMASLDNGRYGTGACAVGIAQACIDACTKYAQERHQFGRPIGEFQLVQEILVDMAVETEASRLLVRQVGALKDRGADRRTVSLKTSMAKYYASEAAVRAARSAIQLYGGYGYSADYHVERYLRDAIGLTLYEGTSQIQKLIIGSSLLQLDAFHRKEGD